MANTFDEFRTVRFITKSYWPIATLDNLKYQASDDWLPCLIKYPNTANRKFEKYRPFLLHYDNMSDWYLVRWGVDKAMDLSQSQLWEKSLIGRALDEKRLYIRKYKNP